MILSNITFTVSRVCRPPLPPIGCYGTSIGEFQVSRGHWWLRCPDTDLVQQVRDAVVPLAATTPSDFGMEGGLVRS